jgi:hypothetical protein
MRRKNREQKLNDGFLFDGFDFKGVHYKPLTAQSLLVLQRVNSPIYTGANESNWLETILHYLFVTSKPIKELLKATESWDESILEFADEFQHQDLLEVGNIINEVLEQSAAAIVETRDDDDGGKK